MRPADLGARPPSRNSIEPAIALTRFIGRDTALWLISLLHLQWEQRCPFHRYSPCVLLAMNIGNGLVRAK